MKWEIFFIVFLFSNSVIGQEWKYLGLGTESISAIAVDWSNPIIIYAGSGSDFSAGKRGGIFKSTDGGASWDTLIRGVTVRDIDVHPDDPKVIYVTLGINCLTLSGIIKSTDAGMTWAPAGSGIHMAFCETGPTMLVIDPKHPDTLYVGTGGVYGGRGYKSTNGGNSWHSIGDTTRLRNGVTAIAVNPESTSIIYAGTAWTGNLLRSTDWGNTWIVTDLPEVGIVYDIQVDRLDTRRVYCGTWMYGFYVSTNAGFGWESLRNGLPDSLAVHKIQILNEPTGTRIFLIGNWRDSGGIYESLEGNNWKKIGISGQRVTAMTMFGRKLYAGQGGIYVKDILTSIENDIPLPQSVNLHQNYPNPFNPSTTITYELIETENVSLEVFNILSRKIKTLVNKKQLPGSYSVSWNGVDEKGNRVSSGVYFYILRVEGSTLAKRMIYLK